VVVEGEEEPMFWSGPVSVSADCWRCMV
jgi:hypothetical protein